MIYRLFLKIGLTWARHHSDGSLPVLMKHSKITCIMGAISSRYSFNRIGLRLSGPAAFPGLRFFKSFSMPATEISNSSIAERTPASLGAMPQRVSRHRPCVVSARVVSAWVVSANFWGGSFRPR